MGPLRFLPHIKFAESISEKQGETQSNLLFFEVEWKCDLIKKDLGDQSAVMDGEFLKPL